MPWICYSQIKCPLHGAALWHLRSWFQMKDQQWLQRVPVFTASENPHSASHPPVQVFFTFFMPATWSFWFPFVLLFVLFFVSLPQFDDAVCTTGVSMLTYVNVSETALNLSSIFFASTKDGVIVSFWAIYYQKIIMHVHLFLFRCNQVMLCFNAVIKFLGKEDRSWQFGA